jgi:hypothetical protein
MVRAFRGPGSGTSFAIPGAAQAIDIGHDHELALAAAGVLALSGCHRDFGHPDYGPPSPPTGLRTQTGDNFIEIFWNANPEPDVAGYNVYVGASFQGKYQWIGSTPGTSFVDRGAVNGTTYYYAVTAYDQAGNESDLSKDVAYDIPRPEGYGVSLTDYRTVPQSAGYEFSTYSIVPWNDQGCDIWYEYYNGVSYMDVNTDTDIQDVGPTASILDISQAPSSGWSPTHDVQLTVGHTYVVWTFDDHYAKVRVSAMSAGHVVFDWAYQLQKSSPLLKRAVVGGVHSRPAIEPHRGN